MIIDTDEITQAITHIAKRLERDETPEAALYDPLLHEPESALVLINLLASMKETALDDNQSLYSACLFVLELCIAHLQSALESGSKLAEKFMDQIMGQLAHRITEQQHSLSYWLPVLNAFYDAHVDLSQPLKNAYYELASEEELPLEQQDEQSHLQAIRDLILELSDLSIFAITEHFFAQSYAMPADFFADLVIDLLHLEEGKDIAILALLHPTEEVREVVFATLNDVLPHVQLTPHSLSRLQAMQAWFSPPHNDTMAAWIRTQRKQGVVFAQETKPSKVSIKATEIDGIGAQGVFIQFQKNRKNRLCGVLFKQPFGIKDAWMTPEVPLKEIKQYYAQSFEESVVLRDVDENYLLLFVNHFLAITSEQHAIPHLQLLEIQEELGIRFTPQKIEPHALLEQLAIQVSPFTQERLDQALTRSKQWLSKQSFTESWFLENPHIDKWVNQFCSYVDGAKTCQFDHAMDAVFEKELEPARETWLFHFLWVALWLQAKARKNELLWQDSLLLAYAIHQGLPLADLPIMQEICYQSVVHSVETMTERRTHLT